MTVAANRESIKQDIGAAKDLLDRYSRVTGQAYQELVMLSFIVESAVGLLVGPMKGQFDDIVTARELRAALRRVETAVKGVRDAA